MASAFDEAEIRVPVGKGVTNILHGKNMTSASSYLTAVDKALVEFKRSILNSTGTFDKNENILSQREKITKMLMAAKDILDEESRSNENSNDRTVLRLKADYKSIFLKYEQFCMETLDNPAFRAETAAVPGFVVTDESENDITIHTGKRAMVFKKNNVNDADFTIIQERDLEAQKIASKTEELNALFVDVGKLVESQQVDVDTVANNVDTAEDATKEGLKQLNRAVRNQRSRGKLFCYFAVFIIIVGGAVVAALILTKRK